uniref:(northern house mosquito) hypothetical protein n=1 Tax=Culex pipiens TaxID=7175 RepID=A0A8D8N9T5_CULPI
MLMLPPVVVPPFPIHFPVPLVHFDQLPRGRVKIPQRFPLIVLQHRTDRPAEEPLVGLLQRTLAPPQGTNLGRPDPAPLHVPVNFVDRFLFQLLRAQPGFTAAGNVDRADDFVSTGTAGQTLNGSHEQRTSIGHWGGSGGNRSGRNRLRHGDCLHHCWDHRCRNGARNDHSGRDRIDGGTRGLYRAHDAARRPVHR